MSTDPVAAAMRAAAVTCLDVVKTLAKGGAIDVVRAQIANLDRGGGCLVIVWGIDDVEDPNTPPNLDRVVPGFVCPECGSDAVAGVGDGDGDLACLACTHGWHDDAASDP